jgi:hypothetical protein
VLLDRKTFATVVVIRTRIGTRHEHTCRFEWRVHPYQETLARYPEWCAVMGGEAS